ncbi:MAG: 50S ribosomal protein L29 [Myxococcota bacterium]
MSETTKAADLRKQSAEDLDQFIKDKEEELFKLRFQHYSGQLENVARLKLVRKEIARAKTVATERRGPSGEGARAGSMDGSNGNEGNEE